MIVPSPLAAALIVAALAAVVALYLLHPPARRVLVPSNLIWERVLRGYRRRDERLRWWLSLLFAALIAATLAYSALRSQAPGSASGGGRIVVVVDNSPTMATRTNDDGTRFERAKRRAAELISSLPAGQQVLLADTMRAIPLPAFEPAHAALARLDRLTLGFGLDPAVPAAARTAPRESFHIFTDGVLLRDLAPQARIESAFESTDNVGISRFEVSGVPGDPLRYQAFVEIENAGGVAKQVEMSLLGADGRRIARHLSVPAFGTLGQTLNVSEFPGGGLRAVIAAAGDGLALDDVAYAYLPTRKRLQVVLVTDSSPYLEKSLSVLPRVRLKVVRPAEFADRGEADAYVFDRYAPAAAPSAPSLLIRPGAAQWLPRPGAEVLQPVIARWDATHPLLEGLSLRDLRIDKASPARLDAADPGILLRSGSGEPLLIARNAPPRWILIAFSLDQANFALHAGFPIFLGNALDWMSDEPVIADARLGEVELPLKSARVLAMDGSDVPARSTGAETRFEAAEPGIYTALSGRSRIQVVVNALDSRLIQVNRSTLPATISRQQAPSPALTDSWLALVAAAVLLLLLEWITYSRRLTV
jgi:hypothetical protein